jgi:putative zinc finger/helix-turn-helix YgiT family protein
MFGYTCEECCEGTVQPTTLRDFPTKFENVPFVVPEAVIGVCDKCGARHFDGREYGRWKRLFHEWQEQQQRVMSAGDIRQLREDLGMSKSDFAALIGATRQSVYHWEKGDRETPQSRMVDNFLKLLRKSCDDGQVDVVRFLRDAAHASGIALKALPREAMAPPTASPSQSP